MKRIAVLIVDDCPVTSDGLESILSVHEDIRVVGTARTGPEALDLISCLAPDVVLVDAQLHGMSGADATRRIKQLVPSVAVMFLAVHPSGLQDGIDAGADRAMLKDLDRKQVVLTIRQIADRDSSATQGPP